MKYASIDFEFYDTAEPKLNLVCASVRVADCTKRFWLHWTDQEDYRRAKASKEVLIETLNKLNELGYTFLAYAVTAEARAFLTLGLDPLKFKWIDLYLEYRCLSNHNDSYAYGKQLIKGRKRFTEKPIPKWERKTEADEKKADSSKQEYGMGAAVYKTLGIVIDNDFKKEMRDLIIACNTHKEEYLQKLEENKETIMNYCDSDVEHLEPMWKEMFNEYKRLFGEYFNAKSLGSAIKTRANYAVRTAIMESVGYPIDVVATRNFSDQVGNILWECQRDINSQFDTSQPLFRANVKKRPLELSWNQGLTRDLVSEWCRANSYGGWTRTDTDLLSLSLKAFSRPVTYRHTYPESNLLAQFQRYLKLKKGLNGFKANESEENIPSSTSKKRFWDYVGSDGRVRPYMGIYGAQSGRSQPSATGFIPLKAAWMRSLISPKAGRAICGIDFASQEFLLAALLSGDKAMLQAYESGDVYLAFGKAIGYIPQDGTKKTHKKERDECKAVVLGLSYDMSEFGLAIDLSEKFGRKVSPEEAKTWIDKHQEAYEDFWQWKKELQDDYKAKGFVELADGWMMWGDNDNFRSVGNVPVQGMGSCIMRKAVELAQEEGLDVIYTLHDAIYIEFDVNGTHRGKIITLARCMDEAFRFYFSGDIKKRATVRLDADVWGPLCGDYKYPLHYRTEYGQMELPVKEQQTYIDERSLEDYNKFSKYFEKEKFDDIQF
jgi:hypothetical protein